LDKDNVEINPELLPYVPFVKAIARMFGDRCEVLLHDASRLEHSIVVIENGHVTGRKVGGPMTDLGLYFLQSDQFKETTFLANYQSEAKNGEKLKSTSIFLRNKKKEIIGFLCINYDVSYMVDLEQKISDFCEVNTHIQEDNGTHNEEEAFPDSLDDLFNRVFNQMLKKIGLPIEKMKKNDKINLVRLLNKRGIFLINGAIDEVARRLNVSRYTIYNYLAEIKSWNGKEVM
jgi:predicted transcriptional regulator YheO